MTGKPFSEIQPLDVSNVGPAEISHQSPVGVDVLARAFDRCANVSGRSHFSQANRDLGSKLQPAYALFLLTNNDTAAQERAYRHAIWKNRVRRPKTGNPALMAVFLALDPETPEQRSLCGDYANALKYAAMSDIAENGFGEFLASTTLKECKRSVRSAKPVGSSAFLEATAIFLQTEAVEGVETSIKLRVRFRSDDGIATTRTVSLPTNAFSNFFEELFRHPSADDLQPVIDAAASTFGKFYIDETRH